MKAKNIVVASGIAFSLAIVSIVYFTRPKIGYIRSYDVFKEYKLSIHYNEQLKQIEGNRKAALDSMEITLVDLEEKLRTNKENIQLMEAYNSLGENYMRNKKGYEEQLEKLSMQYDEKIWKSINEYTATFGSKRGYDFIYGANGDGAIMYADQGHDLTAELLQEMNEKYVNPEQ